MARDKSLLDNETTKRTYQLSDNYKIFVQNEYQKVPCKNCEKFIRYTHLYHYVGNDVRLEFHPNISSHDESLEELKKRAVTYFDNIKVFEVESDGRWCLKKGDEIIGREVQS